MDAAERAIATFAQTVLALAAVASTELASLDWRAILIASLIAGGLAILKAIVASHYGEQTPSIVNYAYSEPVAIGEDEVTAE